MMPVEKWEIPMHIKQLSNEDLARAVFKKAEDGGRENMGVPDLLLAEVAHRLKGAKP